jgi:tetratricopeptide (TPR) repeat protein
LYLLEGDIRLTQGRRDLALDAFERARQLGSPSPDLLQKLVLLYYERERFSDARQALDQLPPHLWSETERRIQLHLLAVEDKLPEDLELDKAASTPEGFVWLGRLLTDAGRGEEAERALRKALELEPGFPAAWSSLFLKKYRIDGPEAARAVIEEGRDQVDEKARSSFLATSYRLLQDFDQAEPHYLETATRFPDSLVAQQDIASFYFDFQKFDKMRPYIDRILKDQKPHDANAPPPRGSRTGSRGLVTAWPADARAFRSPIPPASLGSNEESGGRPHPQLRGESAAGTGV